MIDIKKSLQPLSHYCKDEKEWIGFINLDTGEVELTEGEILSGPTGSPEEARSLREKGLVRFHTHPEILSNKPSLSDITVSHLSGGPEYIITSRGIYEVKPKNVLPVEEVKRRVNLIGEAIDETWEDFKEKPTTQAFLTTWNQNIDLLGQGIPQGLAQKELLLREMRFVLLDGIFEQLKPVIIKDILPTEINFIEW